MMQKNDDSTRGATPNHSATMLPPMSARRPIAGRPSAVICKSPTRVPEWTGKASQRRGTEHDITPAATEQRMRPRSPRSTPSQREQPVTTSQSDQSPALSPAAPENVGGEEQGKLSRNASATASTATSEDPFDSYIPGGARHAGGRHSRPMLHNNILQGADKPNAHEQDDRRCGDHPDPRTTQPPAALDATREPTAAAPAMLQRRPVATRHNNLGDSPEVDGHKVQEAPVGHLGQILGGDRQQEQFDNNVARLLVDLAGDLPDNDMTGGQRAVNNDYSALPHDNDILDQYQVKVDLHRRNMMGSKSIDMNTCAKHTTKSGTR